MKHAHYILIAALAFVAASCSKSLNTPEACAEAVQQPHASAARNAISPTPKNTCPFYSECTGPFTISPFAPAIVKVHQDCILTNTSPFPLATGYVEGFDDLRIPTFPARFFNGTIRFAGQGNDSLFGTLTVQTSVFTNSINPAAGDFTGSEDFTGTFEFIGGTGRYINATGSGTYTAHSDYLQPTTPGTFLGGYTTLTAIGSISVVPHSGKEHQQ